MIGASSCSAGEFSVSPTGGASPTDAITVAPIRLPAVTTTTVLSTTVPLPPMPSGADCTVSELLVPACGAWLGASTAAQSGGLDAADYAIGLDEYEAVAQNTPDILHFYKSGAAKFPTGAEAAMAARPGHDPSLLLYNWKPSNGMTWRQIADGQADHAIQAVAKGLQAYDRKVFLTIWHEPENDIDIEGSGDTPADFVAMYRHVVTTLRVLGVTNAVFVMNYIGYQKWSDVVDVMYPGDDVVDWIAYDPYGFEVHTNFGKFLDSAKRPWPGFYTWATEKAPGKPIMLAEWGFDLSEATHAPTILQEAPDIVRGRFPMLKALVYWNDDSGGFAVRIDQTTDLGIAYGQAYALMANDPYFNSTSTAGAP